MIEKIINKESIINVGIILPEDKKISIEIVFPNPHQYKMNSGELSEKLSIECQSDSLTIYGKQVSQIEIKPIDNSANNNYPIIRSVPTGRGFHWQNEIQAQLPGKIIIQNYNGYLFVINELPVEQYLPYVATSEMNADCPPALLEAQTIAARSWLLANLQVNHPDLNIDVCNDDCCQRYQGVTEVPKESLQAIHNTYGQVLLYRPSDRRTDPPAPLPVLKLRQLKKLRWTGNEICDARYSKCCGGITESYENVWGGEPIPYLSSISDNPQPNDNLMTTNDYESFINSFPPAFCSEKYIKPSDIQKYLGKVDKSGSYYRWNISYSQKELTSIINQKLDLNAREIVNILPLKRGYSGRIIKLQIDYFDTSGKEKSIILNSEYDIRNALHKQFLYSSAIVIEQELDDNRHINLFKFHGAGWGHGAGLCQIGALGMALNGYSAEDILKHYFKGVVVKQLY